MIAFAEFLAGLAFFLVGLQLFMTNLNQLTGERFRYLVARFTFNDVMAAVCGVVLSLLTVGNTMVTPLVAAGLQSMHLLTLRKSIYLVIWSRLGSCFFMYLAGFNMKTFVLFLVGIAGISSALGKPKRLAALMASVFALAMVLFGIQEIKHGAKVLLEMDWFARVIAFALENSWIAFTSGILFVLFSQSLFAALVLVLGSLDAGIFEIQQALLFVYGAYLGEAVLRAMYIPIFKNEFRQTNAIITIFYSVAFLVGMLVFGFDQYFNLSEVFAPYSNSDKVFLAHVNFAIHLIVVLLLTFLISLMEAILIKINLPEKEVEGIKVVDIPSEILTDPLITIHLISEEENRLVGHLLEYSENLRTGKSLQDSTVQNTLHKNLAKNFQIIRDVYRDLLNRSSYHREISVEILEGIERQNLLMSLESNIYEFNQVVDQLRISSGDNKGLATRFLSFSEALDLLLLSLIDIMEAPKPHHIEIIDALTTERKDLSETIQGLFGAELTLDQHVYLIKEVHLFESNAWIIKKLTRLYLSRDKREQKQLA